MKKQILLALLLLGVLAPALAQVNDKEIQARITLRDGSVYNGSVNLKTVDLQTDYGKLVIPFGNVSFIDVGLTPDRANKAKLENLMKQLESEVEETAKLAYEELLKIKIGEVFVIMDYLYSESYQPSETSMYTLTQLLQEIKSLYNLAEPINEKDVINIDGSYTMGGIFAFPSVQIKTEFGPLTIPKDKITKIEVTYVPSTGGENAKTCSLAASKYISGNTAGGWYRTGINVKKGQRINISATGTITLASLSNGTYTPNGVSGSETYVQPGGLYPQYGQLVFKIGENGAMLTAGAKYSGVATENGMLYLSIYETVYNAANTGSYSVSVKIN